MSIVNTATIFHGKKNYSHLSALTSSCLNRQKRGFPFVNLMCHYGWSAQNQYTWTWLFSSFSSSWGSSTLYVTSFRGSFSVSWGCSSWSVVWSLVSAVFSFCLVNFLIRAHDVDGGMSPDFCGYKEKILKQSILYTLSTTLITARTIQNSAIVVLTACTTVKPMSIKLFHNYIIELALFWMGEYFYPSKRTFPNI